jgi:hypothetical protein
MFPRRSFIPCPARQRLVALTSRRREAARGAAHERASCELHDPMASLTAVDSFPLLAIKLWRAERRLPQ